MAIRINGHIDGIEMGAGPGYIYFKGLQLGRLAKCGTEWNQGQHKRAVYEGMWDKLHAAVRASM